MKIQSGRNPSGRGHWKFPEFLVTNKQFKKFLSDNVKELTEINSHADPSLLWDTVKCGIRAAAMCFIKHSRKDRKETIELTEATIASLYALRAETTDPNAILGFNEDIRLLNEELTTAFSFF